MTPESKRQSLANLSDKIARLQKARSSLKDIISGLDKIPPILIKIRDDLDNWDRLYGRDTIGRNLGISSLVRTSNMKNMLGSILKLISLFNKEAHKSSLTFDGMINDIESGRE